MLKDKLVDKAYILLVAVFSTIDGIRVKGFYMVSD